jgi:cephalosporin-C deacetylase
MPDDALAHSYPFDPSYGLSLPELLEIEPPEAPPDFDRFWRARFARAAGIDPWPELAATGATCGDYRVHDLRYRSSDDFVIGGWVLLPREGEIERAAVVGHGYGGRDAPDPCVPLPEAALFFPCARGLGRSRQPGISDNAYYHVLHDIQDRDRYIIGGCVDDLWLCVSAVLALFPAVAGRVAYLGTSFGGGVGALATPWDQRIARVHLEVPTFGHHTRRLELPSVGSAAAVRLYEQRHGNALETLQYYDAAVAASYLRIPTLVAAAMFDPAVPPPGQFAIHNAVPIAYRESFVLDAGHHPYPREAAQRQALAEVLGAFFREL